MRILTVIPITSNTHIDELTYFSLKDVPLGSLVQVPVRNKEIPALVIQSADASHMKALLRGGNFTLKRIGTTEPRVITPPNLMETAQTLADYYATTIGAVINTMLPKSILTTTTSIYEKNNTKKGQIIHKDTLSETYALQAPITDRISLYKSTVRESFAQKKSTLLITPTIAVAKLMQAQIATGLEERVYILNSTTTKNKQLKIFKEIHEAEKPVLLISTAQYATLFRKDLGTIIIEDEASQSYNTLKRPYISTAQFIRSYSERSGLKLILAGTVLSSNTHAELESGKILELAPQATRARSKVSVDIIDTRRIEDETQKTTDAKQPFRAIDKQLEESLKTALKEKKKVFILAPRRGLAPLTVCRDCKTPVLCSTCDTPVTLSKKNTTEREFLCHKCGASKDTDTTCGYCNSWRLDTLGIGIELIEDTLKKMYPNVPIHRVDKKTTATDKKIQDTMKNFTKEGGILLGTALALPFMPKVELSAVASLDAMLSVPSFKIDEEVFALILKVKELTIEKLCIQTRMPERGVLVRAAAGDIATFVREELALRKTLKYPPYTVMIKITRTGSKRQIIDDFQKIMPQLEAYGPRVFKQFRTITASKFALHALLRIKKKEYPSKELTELLRSIQPMFEVKVDIE